MTADGVQGGISFKEVKSEPALSCPHQGVGEQGGPDSSQYPGMSAGAGHILFRDFREGLIVLPWIMFSDVIKHLLES